MAKVPTLTPEQCLAITAEYEAGTKMTVLFRRYNIGYPRLKKILSDSGTLIRPRGYYVSPASRTWLYLLLLVSFAPRLGQQKKE
jgi:hypothetical protein